MRRYKHRSARLLSSFGEVYWEILDSTLRCRYPVAKIDEIKEHSSEGWEIGARRTLYRARQVQVSEDEVTKEFRDARSEFWEMGHRKTLDVWDGYKHYCHRRNTWAPYFHSNLDWDWDISGSLKRLYKFDNPTQPVANHRPSTDIAADGTMWNITARDSQKDIPVEVRIIYTTETGETQYMTFSRDVKSTKVSTGVRASVSDHDDNPGEPDFVDSTQIDLLASSDTFSNEMDGVEGDVATTALERTPSDSGSLLNFKESVPVSWSAQDIDGLPDVPCTHDALENEAVIEELASELEGEGTTSELSATTTQVCSWTLTQDQRAKQCVRRSQRTVTPLRVSLFSMSVFRLVLRKVRHSLRNGTKRKMGTETLQRPRLQMNQLRCACRVLLTVKNTKNTLGSAGSIDRN